MRRDRKRSKLSRIQTIVGIVPRRAQQSRQLRRVLEQRGTEI
jgi:hypothetical protein